MNGDPEDWESEMRGELQPRSTQNDTAAFLSSSNFYKLPLPHDKIFLVDDSHSLEECKRVLCVVRCLV